MATSAYPSIYATLLAGCLALNASWGFTAGFGEAAINRPSASVTMAVGPQGDEQFPVVTVSYDDLRLETETGLNELYDRLEYAAHIVCGPREYRGSNPILRREWQNCLGNTMGNAVSDIDHHGLSLYHREQAGRDINDGRALANAR